MLCTLVDAPFDGPDWTFEPKFDGLRVLARFNGRAVTLLVRRPTKEESGQGLSDGRPHRHLGQDVRGSAWQ
jgi:hypothetical protein